MIENLRKLMSFQLEYHKLFCIESEFYRLFSEHMHNPRNPNYSNVTFVRLLKTKLFDSSNVRVHKLFLQALNTAVDK